MALQDHSMWRKPRHHLDLDHPGNHVHWIELFYDLIHVVTIFLLGNFLSHHLDLQGFLIFAGLFAAVWFAWADSGMFNSFFVPTDIWHRVLMCAQIVTTMFMAAAIPAIASEGLSWFIAFYAINRALTAGMYLRARQPDVHTASLSLAWVLGRNSAVLVVVFAIAVMLPHPWNVWVFALGVAASQLQWVVPRIGVVHLERAVPRWAHMNERFALLMLIVLGEGFFKLVVTLTEKGLYKAGTQVLLNFTFGGLAVFMLAWIYFDYVANGRLRNTRPATVILNWFGHFGLMLAGVMIGVALAGEVKVGFWEPYDTHYGALGCFGLAAYLFLLGVLQGLVDDREVHRFARWDVKAFGIALAIGTWFVVPHVPSLVGNLLWGTALASQVVIPMGRGYRTFREEHAERARN